MRARLAKFVLTFLWIAAVLAALAALAAQGGRFNSTLDILAQFASIYLCVGLGVLGGAALSGYRRLGPLTAVALLTVAASAALIVPEFLRPSPPTAASGAPQQIKIIQFNALRSNADLEPIVDWLIAQRPDIVTITEARHDLRDAIRERTGWHLAGGAGDLMIFSARPRLKMNRPDFIHGLDLNFVNATYPSASGPYDLVTVHFLWPTGSTQRHQWARVADIVARLPRDRMILTGDLNATPWGFTMRNGERRLPLLRRDRAFPTFPARWDADGPIRSPIPLLPIDHFYAGPGWATVSVERGPALGSDHYPVIVTLAPVSGAP